MSYFVKLQNALIKGYVKPGLPAGELDFFLVLIESILFGSISQVIIAPSNSALFVSLPKQAVNSANWPSDSIRVLHEEALKYIDVVVSSIGKVSWSSANQKLS